MRRRKEKRKENEMLVCFLSSLLVKEKKSNINIAERKRAYQPNPIPST